MGSNFLSNLKVKVGFGKEIGASGGASLALWRIEVSTSIEVGRFSSMGLESAFAASSEA